MKRGMWPVANTSDQTMLHRVDVAILDVACVVGLIANQMLPEAPLPGPAFVAFDPNGTQLLLLRECLCKPTLDQAPACREIGVTRR
jgi:hypothetical protein